jgi:hypothetical protein
MSELLQSIIVVGFGALCFGVGYLTADRHAQPLARRNDQALFRPLQLVHRQMGMGRTTERIELLSARPPLPAALNERKVLAE